MTKKMSVAQMQRLIIKHDKALDAVMEIFKIAAVPPEEGEALLLWMAGSSAGIRQVSIREDWVQPAALGWQYAAEYGGDHE